VGIEGWSMERMIQVFTTTGEVKTVALIEAEKIVQETYDDHIGGLVVDLETNEVIWRIGPNVGKIKIVQMLGGG
jgi:hypothetical protein